MAAAPTYPGVPKNPAVTIVPADTTTKKTFYTAGASGAKLASMSVATDETAARDIQVWVTVSAVDYLLATITIPLGSGNTGGVGQVNVLALLMSVLDQAGYMLLAAAAIIKVNTTTTVTAAKTMYITGTASDF
jgi:hypothetical protein